MFRGKNKKFAGIFYFSWWVRIQSCPSQKVGLGSAPKRTGSANTGGREKAIAGYHLKGKICKS
jgi:hypothetical protein